MRMIDLIETKRDGGRHTAADLAWLVRGVVNGDVPDFQVAAWLMAAFLRGLDSGETADLTLAMAESGRVLDWRDLPGPVVDKHSTGGVGDKTTLIVVPLAAATGLSVAKMSGRGLGFTGGTLDKLESIPGMSIELSIDHFRRQVAELGCAITGQTADLAPADKRLYALRDLTGTVPSLPLIAASVMSKKIAAGARAIVLDVKYGRGAFMKSAKDALALARTMVGIGQAAGRETVAVLGAMDQPLGSAVGNAIEVKEAIDTLHGNGPSDLLAHCLKLTAWLHVAAGRSRHVDEVLPEIEAALASGLAAERLARMIAAQGGDARVVESPGRLPRAPHIVPVLAPKAGVVVAVDAQVIGLAAADLGAGRRRPGEPVDPVVGVELAIKTGARVSAGDVLALVHARDEIAAGSAAATVVGAYTLGDRQRKRADTVPTVVTFSERVGTDETPQRLVGARPG